MKGRELLLLFLKCPEKGRVKTRLSRVLGEDKTLLLYVYFLRMIFTSVREAGMDSAIAFSGDIASFERAGLELPAEIVFPQEGSGLGERMFNAFTRAGEEGAEKTVMIGSDSPDIPFTIIRDAFSALSRNDIVIGPSGDGGYYCIGLTPAGLTPRIFTGIEWSTSAVLSQTEDRIKDRGLRYARLPEWNDIDTIHDLMEFVERTESAGLITETVRLVKDNQREGK